MSSQPRDNTIVFVIDTEQYSGNFERQMCAFLTGVTGDCGVGKEEARMFKMEVKDKKLKEEFDSIIEVCGDSHGCYRPCSIWVTPGWVNNGMGVHSKKDKMENGEYDAYQSVGIFFFERPSDKMIELMKERASKFIEVHKNKHACNQTIDITGFRIITVKVKREDSIENI